MAVGRRPARAAAGVVRGGRRDSGAGIRALGNPFYRAPNRRADRIYVMQGGRVVGEGSFEELAEVPGLFREVARRQVA